ncbi:MAG: hypothetical protein IT371_20670 [Deltaproteobacteria bacterium]|nr:hypothetical protein [Deltaproteobacteria bacterium]
MDVMGETRPVVPRVGRRVRRMLKVLGDMACPEVEVGLHCYAPFAYPLMVECWAHLPARSVFGLRRAAAGPSTRRSKGVPRLVAISSWLPLTDSHRDDELAIADRQTAAQSLVHAEHGDCSRAERAALRVALKHYGSRDTEVMLQIVERLRRMVRP